VADFASLYPPYTWIPACAGMTEEVQEKPPAGGLRVSLNSLPSPKNGGAGAWPTPTTWWCSGMLPGSGVSPDSSFFPQDWGTRGVEDE